jgi:hypothetical protein
MRSPVLPKELSFFVDGHGLLKKFEDGKPVAFCKEIRQCAHRPPFSSRSGSGAARHRVNTAIVPAITSAAGS